MSLSSLLSSVAWGDVLKGGGIVLLLLMTLLQISPIKIDPWGWIARKIGRAMNAEIIDKVDTLDKEVKAIRTETTEHAIISCRIRILRFGDEILHGDRHSQDHFDQTLQDIDRYEKYCKDHPDFENNITGLTIARIKDVYRRQCDKNDFI